MEADPDSSLYLNVASVNSSLDLPGGADSVGTYIGFAILLWCIVAFLAGVVRTLASFNGSTSELLSEDGSPSSRRLLKLLAEKNQALLTFNGLLVLNGVAFVTLFTQLLLYRLSMFIGNPVLLLIVSICIAAFVLVLASRILPKIIARHIALPFGRYTSLIILLIHGLFSPLSRPVTNWLSAVLGYGAPNLQYLSGEDLKAMADIGEAQGTIEEEERELIHSIMDFGDTTVREVMISRLDMNALPVTANLEEVLTLIQSSGHSRLPIYEDHLDNIVGFVYAKDLLLYMSSSRKIDALNWRQTLRKPFFVPAGKPLDDLLRDFQTKKMHIAIVVDDYGGTAGLVTMEDVLEEIVGDIRDEYDEAETELHEQIDETTHVFDARINLDDLSDLLNIELDFESYDFETLGGLIFHLTGEIPEEGDEVPYESLTMRIESVENHRIGRVVIKVQPPTADKSLVA